MARRAKRRKLDKDKDSRKKARRRARRRQNATEQADAEIAANISPVIMPLRLPPPPAVAAPSTNDASHHHAFSSDFSDNDDFDEVIHNGRLYRNPTSTRTTIPTQPQPVSTEIAPDVGVVHQTTRTSLASTAVPEICTIPSADMDKVDDAEETNESVQHGAVDDSLGSNNEITAMDIVEDAEEINESVQHGAVDDSLGSNNNDIAPQADIVPLDANGNPRDPNVLYTVDGIKILPPKQKDNNAIARTRLLWILYHKRQLTIPFCSMHWVRKISTCG